MTKELEALNYIKNNIRYHEPVSQEDEEKRQEVNRIIETALIKYEDLQTDVVYLEANGDFWQREYNKAEKQLKALEIIKEKRVNVGNLVIYCFETNDTYEEYVEAFNYADNYWDLGQKLLIKEEYDLLKEVLL